MATLLHDPELIILDEPFTGLDPVNVQIFIDIIKEEARKEKTIIFSSHQMPIVEELCDELVLLKKGVAEVFGTIPDIKAAYGFKNLVMNLNEEVERGLKQLKLTYQLDKNTVKVKMSNSASAMTILKELDQIGVVLDEFRVAPPTMQEIFVERIG